MSLKCDAYDDDGVDYRPCGEEADYQNPNTGDDLCGGHLAQEVHRLVSGQLFQDPDTCYPAGNCDWQVTVAAPEEGYDFGRIGYALDEKRVAYLTVWTCPRCERSVSVPIRYKPPNKHQELLDQRTHNAEYQKVIGTYRQKWQREGALDE